ncbi:unnamed protein product, partial [Closterium sp. NIES-53]
EEPQLHQVQQRRWQQQQGQAKEMEEREGGEEGEYRQEEGEEVQEEEEGGEEDGVRQVYQHASKNSRNSQHRVHYSSLRGTQRRGWVGAVVVEGEMMQRLGVTADQIYSLVSGQAGVRMTGECDLMSKRDCNNCGTCSTCSLCSNCSWPVPFLVLLHGSSPLATDSFNEAYNGDREGSCKRQAGGGDERESGGDGAYKPDDCNNELKGCRGSNRRRSRKSRPAALSLSPSPPTPATEARHSPSPALSLTPSPSIPSLLSLGFDAVIRKPLRKPALLAALLPLFSAEAGQGHCEQAGGGAGRGGRARGTGGGGGGKSEDVTQGGPRRGEVKGRWSGVVTFEAAALQRPSGEL